MSRFAYLFERFPSFGQTFCYREVAELYRQGLTPPIFSVRRPKDEPLQDWDKTLVDRVQYLPEEAELVPEIDRLMKRKKVGREIVGAVTEWGRRSDFLRLYQAVYIGLRLKEVGIDRVHAHFAGLAARTAFWIKKFFGVPFSFTGHANDIFAPREFEIGLDQVIASATAIITESDYAAHFLEQRFPESASKIHRVYNGIDLSEFEAAKLFGTIPSIVGVGRLIEKKGFGDLIEACALLKDRQCDFHCQIIGEGPLEENLRTEIEKLGLQKNVVLAGPLPQQQIRSQLANATFFALPCIAEKSGGMDNLPTVIMEAMAAGLPVISTPIGGVPEMVVDNETGFLVPPGSPAALAEAIEKVIVDLSLARKFGQAGLARAQKLFSIERNVRELLGFIRA